MAAVRTDRRLHAVPDLRMARGVASSYRTRREGVVPVDRRAAASPTAKPHSSCRSPSSRGARYGGCAGSARICATTTRRCCRAISRKRVHAGPLPRDCGGNCAQRMQADPQLRHDWIEFEKMPQTVGSRSIRSPILSVTPNANSAHIAQLGGDWETFYRAKRSSATRRHDRAKRKRMSEFGDIRFVTAADAGRCPHDARNIDASRKAGIRAQGHSRHVRAAGLPGIFSRFRVESGDARIWPMSAASRSGRPARRRISRIVFGDCYYHMLSSYCDGELAHYGPGALHLRELLAHAIERGLRRFDFTIGDERYKLEWSDLHLQLCDYSAAATWRGWPASVLSAARRRLKRFIKQTPAMWRAGVAVPLRVRRAAASSAASLTSSTVRSGRDWPSSAR